MLFSNKASNNILIVMIPSFITYYALLKLLDFIPSILHKKRRLGWKGNINIIGHRGSRIEVKTINFQKIELAFMLLGCYRKHDCFFQGCCTRWYKNGRA